MEPKSSSDRSSCSLQKIRKMAQKHAMQNGSGSAADDAERQSLFSQLCKESHSLYSESCQSICTSEYICFAKLEVISGQARITISVSISKDLDVEVFHGGLPVSHSFPARISTRDEVTTMLQQLVNLQVFALNLYDQRSVDATLEDDGLELELSATSSPVLSAADRLEDDLNEMKFIEVVPSNNSRISSYSLDVEHESVHVKNQEPSHQLQNTAVSFVWYKTPEDETTSISDNCTQQKDQSVALSNVLISNMNDRENVDENDDDLLCSLLSDHSYVFDCKTFSGAGDVVSVQQIDDDTETQNTCDQMISKSKTTHTNETQHQCDVCHMGFDQLSCLNKHKCTHTGERRYRCDVCQMQFARADTLKRHKRTHTGEKPYSCDMCNAGFAQRYGITLHKLRRHAVAKPYKCQLCNVGFAYAYNLRLHNQRKHSVILQQADLNTHKCTQMIERPYVCEICASSFKYPSALCAHKVKHSGVKPYLESDVIRVGQMHIDTETQNSGDPVISKSNAVHTSEKVNSCDVCHKTFVRSTTLKVHKHSHTDERPYVCEICASSFKYPSALAAHKVIHSGAIPFPCDICHVRFARKGDLKKHKRTHMHESGAGDVVSVQQIDDDSETQNSGDQVISKSNAVHTSEKVHSCDVCHKTFVRAGTLKIHKRTHTGERPYECEICASLFKSSSSLASHKVKHSGAKPYLCDVCYVGFARKSGLKCHKRIHMRDSGASDVISDVISVQQIDDDTETQNSGDQVISKSKTVHTSEKVHRCKVCYKTFVRATNLTVHKRIHTGERPYVCEICASSFKSSSSLASHKLIHSGAKPYACDVCHARYARKAGLKYHKRTHMRESEGSGASDMIRVRQMHSDTETQNSSGQVTSKSKAEKLHRCNVCYKSFARVTNLNVHIRSHTDERPYMCDICTNSFKTSSQLYSHRQIHSGAKPHACDVCHMQFLRKECLRRHIRCHTGERPYVCDICGKAFVRLAHLARHQWTHSNATTYTCDLCGKWFTTLCSLKTHLCTHTGERT